MVNGTKMKEIKDKGRKERDDSKQVSTAVICLGCIKIMSTRFLRQSTGSDLHGSVQSLQTNYCVIS